MILPGKKELVTIFKSQRKGRGEMMREQNAERMEHSPIEPDHLLAMAEDMIMALDKKDPEMLKASLAAFVQTMYHKMEEMED